MTSHGIEKPKRDAWRTLRRLLPVCFAVALTALMGSTDAWAKGTVSETAPTAPAAQTTSAPATTETSAPDFDGAYAAREASTQGLDKFEGGSVVIITTTGVVIVLLIIVLILLL